MLVSEKKWKQAPLHSSAIDVLGETHLWGVPVLRGSYAALGFVNELLLKITSHRFD
ncbi:hypothetical protein ACU8KH_02467 [Lachancea thermotolerans]